MIRVSREVIASLLDNWYTMPEQIEFMLRYGDSLRIYRCGGIGDNGWNCYWRVGALTYRGHGATDGDAVRAALSEAHRLWIEEVEPGTAHVPNLGFSTAMLTVALSA